MSENGETKKAGDGVSDDEMVKQVSEQTSSDIEYDDVSKLEKDGALTDKPIAEADADDLAE